MGQDGTDSRPSSTSSKPPRVGSQAMIPEDRDDYEDRIRAKHPEKLWWEDWRGNKWLIFWLVVAVVAMIVVGYVIS
jgi:hypothetical protein